MAHFQRLWTTLLERLPYRPEFDREAFRPYTAREMTRRQCALFDRVLTESARGAELVEPMARSARV